MELEKTLVDLTKVSAEMIDRIEDIPLGSSEYQNITLLQNAQLTPCRAYRTLLLKLKSKIDALDMARIGHKNAELQVELLEIDIKELSMVIDGSKIYVNDKRKIEIEIEQKKLEIEKITIERKNQEKLIKDGIVEVMSLYNAVSKYPKYTREQFEAEEPNHWRLELNKQLLGIVGEKASLLAMGQYKTRLTQSDVINILEELQSPTLVTRLQDTKEVSDGIRNAEW